MRYGWKEAFAAIVAVIVLAVALAGGLIAWQGVTTVADPHEVVAEARLTNGLHRSDMMALPLGGFAILTDLEGVVEITCKQGNVAQGGYVSPSFGGAFTVSADCEVLDTQRSSVTNAEY